VTAIITADVTQVNSTITVNSVPEMLTIFALLNVSIVYYISMLIIA